jgi:hypothetical protein
MSQRFFCLALLGAALCANSCRLPPGPDFGKGTLTLLLPQTAAPENPARYASGGLSRSALADSVTGSLVYRLTLAGPGETLTLESGGGRASISLNAGEWIIDAAAYAPGDPATLVGSGTLAITVAAGQNRSVRIPMQVDAAYEGALTEIYIHSEADLRRIGTDFAIDGSFITAFYLERDIVLTQPWTPIGDASTPFKALFDGQGHSITINAFADLSAEYLGLFGYTAAAEVQDLTLRINLGRADAPLDLTGTNYISVGALTGYASLASLFENITVTGTMHLVSGTAYSVSCGGIIGANYGSTIRSCTVKAALSAEGQNTTGVSIGGVAGENQNSAGTPIEQSSFTGTIRADTNNENTRAGGITGAMSTGTIRDCYASGRIEAFGGNLVYAGGIAGMSNNIENCYAWADVSASGNLEVYAAGIVGELQGPLSQCYARGDVSATNNSTGDCYAGGIAGQNYQGQIEYALALNTRVEANNSPEARGIAGRKQLGTTFTSNFVASSMTISPNGSPAADPDLDGDTTTYDYTDFQGPAPGAAYGSGFLDWDFTGTGGWTFIPGYYYPVLPWQTAPPEEPGALVDPPS